jgi:hypothetical protein
MNIQYVLLIIISIVLLVNAYIRLHSRFWSKQPVFHTYKPLYWFKAPCIISPSLPSSNNKFYSRNVNTITMKALYDPSVNNADSSVSGTSDIQAIENLLYREYLRTETVTYNPTWKNVQPYFTGHVDKCYISTYKKLKSITGEKNIIGVITSRPVYIYLEGMHTDTTKNRNTPIISYYVDYLCVNKENRGKDIAPKLIQTHEYNQRHRSKCIHTSIFKREGVLIPSIVPLLIYRVYVFDIMAWRRPMRFSNPNMNVVEITSENFSTYMEYMNDIVSKKFSGCFIIPHVNNILQLIITGELLVYILVDQQGVIGLYVFRNPHVKYGEVGSVECVASASDCVDNMVYSTGFLHAFYKVKERIEIKYEGVSVGRLLVENISNNDFIIRDITRSYVPKFTTKTAYYFYNYASRPMKSNRAFVIV